MGRLQFWVESDAYLWSTATDLLGWATVTSIESNGKFPNILCNDAAWSGYPSTGGHTGCLQPTVVLLDLSSCFHGLSISMVGQRLSQTIVNNLYYWNLCLMFLLQNKVAVNLSIGSVLKDTKCNEPKVTFHMWCESPWGSHSKWKTKLSECLPYNIHSRHEFMAGVTSLCYRVYYCRRYLPRHAEPWEFNTQNSAAKRCLELSWPYP